MCGHCCLEQRRSDAVAGSLFLKRRRGSHGVTALLPQGRKQYSSSAECPLLSVPGKGKELVHATPRRCSWMLEVYHCNCEDCTYLQRKETVNYTELPRLFFLKQAGIFRKLKLPLFLLNRTEQNAFISIPLSAQQQKCYQIQQDKLSITAGFGLLRLLQNTPVTCEKKNLI